MKRILVVAAHPDDEVLGCGGTIARLAKEGFEVFTLILGEGLTSRDARRNPGKKRGEIEALKDQAYKANKVLGVKDVFMHNFGDNRFDGIPLLDIVKVIEKTKKEVSARVIFTHNDGDLNIDHRLTYKAVLTAARPLSEETVKEIYSFEVLSSTEWNYPYDFSPDTFYNIEKTIELKLKAMRAYEKELRSFPHPRSLEGIRVNARQRGMQVGAGYAEAFKCIRSIK